jgi:hypothetical protein
MTTTSDIKYDAIQESKNLADKMRNSKDCPLHIDSNLCYLRVVVKYNQPGRLLLNMATF